MTSRADLGFGLRFDLLLGPGLDLDLSLECPPSREAAGRRLP